MPYQSMQLGPGNRQAGPLLALAIDPQMQTASATSRFTCVRDEMLWCARVEGFQRVARVFATLKGTLPGLGARESDAFIRCRTLESIVVPACFTGERDRLFEDRC